MTFIGGAYSDAYSDAYDIGTEIPPPLPSGAVISGCLDTSAPGIFGIIGEADVAIVQDNDPGAVGAGRLWLQTNADGVVPENKLWVRNTANDGWLPAVTEDEQYAVLQTETSIVDTDGQVQLPDLTFTLPAKRTAYFEVFVWISTGPGGKPAFSIQHTGAFPIESAWTCDPLPDLARSDSFDDPLVSGPVNGGLSSFTVAVLRGWTRNYDPINAGVWHLSAGVDVASGWPAIGIYKDTELRVKMLDSPDNLP